MAIAFLVVSILAEVTGTISLRMAVRGSRFWYAGVGVGYVVAFTALSLALDGGVPLGVAYAIWAAAGVALTALLGTLLFKERLTWVMGVGFMLIVGGVLLIEFNVPH